MQQIQQTEIEPMNAHLFVELMAQFFGQGWMLGSSGGMAAITQSLGNGEDGGDCLLLVSPSSVPKERLTEQDLFAFDLKCIQERCDDICLSTNPIFGPTHLRPSACTPLFLLLLQSTPGTSCVIHTHSKYANLVTVLFAQRNCLEITNQEMLKGVMDRRNWRSFQNTDKFILPIVENKPQEQDLLPILKEAIDKYPHSPAFLVRRHGLFVLGPSWQKTKVMLESMPEEEHGNSSEEEEEEDEPVPVRQQQVRMVVTDASSGYGQESTTDSPIAKTAPQAIVTTTSTTTKVASNEDVSEAQEAAIEAARKRHQEAIEKARAEAIKMQEEAPEEQRQQQIKAQQEAAKLQAEQRAAQLKAQQEAQKAAAVQQQQQSKPAPTQPKAAAPAPPKAAVPQPKSPAPAQPAKAPIQPKPVQPPAKAPIQPKTAPPPTSPTKTPIASNNPTRQAPPLAKEPEPLEPPKPILTHAPFQPKNPKAENHSWPPPQEEEDLSIEGGKRNKILDDNSWQVQKRIQLEYQPEKQSVPRVKAQDWVPENDAEHPVLKTIYQPGRIAPNPTSGRLWPPPGYGEEEEIEIGHANKVKTMGDDDWKQGEGEQLQNGEVNSVGNAPWSRQAAGGNVKNVQWPPPENQLEHGEFGRGRLNVQWPPTEHEEQEQKQAEGRLQAAGSNVRSVQWPPPENISEPEAFGAGRMQVQWPPTEQEEREVHQVEILQTHLPTKPHQREWPPAHYVAAQVGGVEAQ
uniref:Class II aldolase/adducin N-terminal domain-containing protein n=2 Tax=Meloidogyne TaxID=189290 RepID=A0A915LFP5_MELJA